MNDEVRAEGRRHEDLRGSTPVLSARDVLLELRDDVRDMKTKVDVLASQDLDRRVSRLEQSQSKLLGQVAGIAAVISTFIAVAGLALAALKI